MGNGSSLGAHGGSQADLPAGLDLHVNKDNTRAIHFYEKHGFVISGEALNWRSGAPVHKMSWRPSPAP